MLSDVLRVVCYVNLVCLNVFALICVPHVRNVVCVVHYVFFSVLHACCVLCVVCIYVCVLFGQEVVKHKQTTCLFYLRRLCV